jgi:hypothetical protein
MEAGGLPGYPHHDCTIYMSQPAAMATLIAQAAEASGRQA